MGSSKSKQEKHLKCISKLQNFMTQIYEIISHPLYMKGMNKQNRKQPSNELLEHSKEFTSYAQIDRLISSHSKNFNHK